MLVDISMADECQQEWPSQSSQSGTMLVENGMAADVSKMTFAVQFLHYSNARESRGALLVKCAENFGPTALLCLFRLCLVTGFTYRHRLTNSAIGTNPKAMRDCFRHRLAAWRERAKLQQKAVRSTDLNLQCLCAPETILLTTTKLNHMLYQVLVAKGDLCVDINRCPNPLRAHFVNEMNCGATSD